jgi:hypothetical protein
MMMTDLSACDLRRGHMQLHELSSDRFNVSSTHPHHHARVKDIRERLTPGNTELVTFVTLCRCAHCTTRALIAPAAFALQLVPVNKQLRRLDELQ